MGHEPLSTPQDQIGWVDQVDGVLELFDDRVWVASNDLVDDVGLILGLCCEPHFGEEIDFFDEAEPPKSRLFIDLGSVTASMSQAPRGVNLQVQSPA